MEMEDRERLVRVETKIDLITPIVPLVQEHESALKLVRRVLGFLGSILVVVIGGVGMALLKKWI
jgi:hypothetical protein